MRSRRYPERYRVGSIDGCDVYWHPQFGYAIDVDARLTGIDDAAGIDWFDREEDYFEVFDGVLMSGGELLKAMDGRMQAAIAEIEANS